MVQHSSNSHERDITYEHVPSEYQAGDAGPQDELHIVLKIWFWQAQMVKPCLTVWPPIIKQAKMFWSYFNHYQYKQKHHLLN